MKLMKLLSSRTRPREPDAIPDGSKKMFTLKDFFKRCKTRVSRKRHVQASSMAGLDIEVTTPCVQVSGPTLMGRLSNSCHRTTRLLVRIITNDQPPSATYPPSVTTDRFSRLYQTQSKVLLSPLSMDLPLPDPGSLPCTPPTDEGLWLAQISEEHEMSNALAPQTVPASIAQLPMGLLPFTTGQLPPSTITEGPSPLLQSSQGVQRVGFDSLPVEMLLEIFTFCMPLADWTRMSEFHSCSSAFGAKSIMRQVCKTWKDIVDDMCALVHVRIGIEDTDHPRSVISVMRPTEFRLRTWNTLSVHFGEHWPQADLELANRMSVLVSQFQRIHISCHHYPRLPDSADGGLDLVHHTAESSYAPSSKPQNLHDFSWSCNYGIDESLPPEWRLPWKQLWNMTSPDTGLSWSDLTCLCLDCPLSFDDCLNVLRVSPRLGSASFVRVSREKETRQRDPNQQQVVSAANSSSNQMPPVHHAGLRTLKLGLVDDVIPFFERIVLANLRSLDLHVDQLTAEILQLNPNPISWAHLYDLSVQCDMSLADAHAFLVGCPSLKTFQWRCLRTTSSSSLQVVDDLWPAERFSSFKLLRDSSTIDFAPLIAFLGERLYQTPILILPSISLSIDTGRTVFAKMETVILTSAITISDFFLICDVCTTIKVLEISLSSDTNGVTTDRSRYMPYLHSLSISSTVNLRPLFDCLELEKLTALQLHWDLGVSATADGLEFFLSRSGCSLERLSLTNRSIDDITTCLTTVSASLMDLTIDNDVPSLTVGDLLLRRLTHGSGASDRCLCPKLNSIALSPLSSIDGVLVDMICSRQSNNHTGQCPSCKANSTFRDLGRVEVEFEPSDEDSHPMDKKCLAAFAKQGPAGFSIDKDIAVHGSDSGVKC